MKPTTDYDTVIIGAGAAGLAAGRTLHDAGQRILILEARPRIGGRIWTDTEFAPLPVELGAEFIHGERAVTHALVQAAGLHTLVTPRYPHLRWGEGAVARPLAHLPTASQALINQLFAAYHQLPQTLPQLPADLSLAAYLRGAGFDAQAIAVADVLLAQTCSASIETLSCADLVREMQVDHAGKDEFRIGEGYVALVAWLARALPIRLNTPVRKIEWGNAVVTIRTEPATVHAKRCIITLPISLLQAGVIEFAPALSAAKQAAIHAFRMEPATKLLYRFHQPVWDEELVYMAHPGLVARWWTPGYGRPVAPGGTTITAYITAERARQIDALTESEALALGLRELAVLLDCKHIEDHCMAARRVAWAHEAYTRGGYAHLPPGAADARPVLAQPEGDRLFFAGEATAHDTNPQTVHGAIESGWRAAAECLMNQGD
jgi:monoamine oxidase